MTAAIATPARSEVLRGIFYMIGATLLFAAVNALVKWEVDRYPVGEVAFFRSLFSLIPCYLLILPRTGLGVFRTTRLKGHIGRALLQIGSMSCIFLAFQRMPLADTTAITFSAPLFTTLLSIVLLKEPVGIHRWGALIVGFLGVLVVTRPGAGLLDPGALFALGNAVLISVMAIAIRQMRTTESLETLTVYQLTLLALLTALLLPFGFVLPGWTDLLLLALAGLVNGVAQYWWTKALHLAPASAVVPFNYLSLVWAMIVGFLVWGDVPAPALLMGSAIVVGSGLYILWRETVRRHAVTLAAPKSPA